jgi:PDZ domain/PilZ domain
MSFSPPTEKDNAPAINRRACPRGALSRVVLAYFGQHNWGKLLNLTERGMALEFDQLPPADQPISFTLEIMGPPRAQPGRELPRNCIHVNGQVVWMQEFERTAGVQFVASAGGTEEQLRQWLSANTAFAESDKPQQETVSSATQNVKSDITNRRDYTRKALSVVVLAYFGQHNWGKLLNLSESGMALEFDQLPPVGQPINFTLEIMGPSPAQPGRELPRNCIHVNGQVEWTQEFERAAGVRFVSLDRDTQQQIVQWLSLEPSATDIADDEIEHDRKEAHWLESPVSPETTDESITDRQRRDSVPRESSAEILSEPEPELEPEIQPQLDEEFPLETLSPTFAEEGKAQHDIIEVQAALPPPTSPETTSPKTDSPQDWVSEFLESSPEILPKPKLASEPQVNKDPRGETSPTVFVESDKAQHNTMDAQSVAPLAPSPETTTELADDLQRWLSEFRRSKAEIAAKNAQLDKEPVLDTSPIVFAQPEKVEQDTMQAQVVVPPTSSPEATNQVAGVPQPDVPLPQDSEQHESSAEEVGHAELPRQQKPKQPSRLNAPMVRLALVAACVCLMLFAVVASVRMIRSRWNRTSAVTKRILKPSDKAVPSGTGPRSATETARVFQDELADASKKRPLPRFKDRALTNPTDRVANVLDSPAVSAKRRSPTKLKLSAPKPVPIATNSSADKSALTEPAVVPTGVLAVQGKPLGGIPVDAKPPSPLASISPTHSPASPQFTNGNMASALGVFGSSNGGSGVKIIEVMPNSPAATAGLAVGDVITAIDGNVVSSEQSLDSQLANRKAGSKVRVTFMHSAWMIEATVRIGSLPVTDHTYGFLFP